MSDENMSFMERARRQRTRRRFPEGFKRDAVDLVHTTGRPIAAVARELKIPASTLRNWVRQEHIGRREAEIGNPDPHAHLVTALRRFLLDAQRTSEGTTFRNMPVYRFAEALAALPSCADADAAALAAAKATGYALTRSDRGKARPAGRALDAGTLFRTGIAALFHNGGDADLDGVARDLAGYLAGPPVQIWEYATVDADLHLSGPVPVVDGWDLFTPTTDELHALLPLPSTADQQPDPPFDPDKYGGLAILRRSDPDDRPYRGLVVQWPQAHPAHRLWQPLLALSLYDNPVLQLWARYRVEPGRRVDRGFDQVTWDIWSPDGEIEIEVPFKGGFRVDRDGEARLRRFLVALAPLLDAATTRPGKKGKASAARLRRCAEHFLSAGEHAHDEGEVFPDEYNADAVLHYIIALEGLIAGTDSDRQDFARKVSQRAALLAGFNDAERLDIADVVRAAYGARSKYAHGDEPREITLPALRRIVRRCLLARLVLGDPTAGGQTLADLADEALLSHAVLERQILQPLSEFRQQLDEIPPTR
jgi:transposase-like protein